MVSVSLSFGSSGVGCGRFTKASSSSTPSRRHLRTYLDGKERMIYTQIRRGEYRRDLYQHQSHIQNRILPLSPSRSPPPHLYLLYVRVGEEETLTNHKLSLGFCPQHVFTLVTQIRVVSALIGENKGKDVNICIGLQMHIYVNPLFLSLSTHPTYLHIYNSTYPCTLIKDM